MELKLKDTINVSTQHGPCAVDLMIGDITTLEKSNQVDFIMVSAFPGDYSPVSGTLIGALYKRLNISVRKLSIDKELDLRRHFSIWMSKPLDQFEEFESPAYKRLICFERMNQAHPATTVGDIFRGLMPIVNNQDTTIITPLLATGCQSYSPSVMMSAMVSSACNWMKVGLPLRRLKIVIYARDSRLSKAEDDVVKLFASLKKKWGSSPATVKNTLLYDIYMSYNLKDSALAENITKKLREASGKVKVFSQHQELEETTAWQEQMFDTMNSCKRIVVVLTSAYMESKVCLEQFNIGMCCSRVRGYEMLAPLYLQDIPNVPTYIMLVQYIDCRINGDSALDQTLATACTTIITSLSVSVVQSEDKYNYDVFISYSHQKSDEAKKMKELLEKEHSGVKVFYDSIGLEMGFSWQKSLYTCIDNCRCMVAFICDEYLASSVCMEELSIAAARAATQSDFRLVTLCISDLTNPPSWLLGLHLIDARPSVYYCMSHTCDQISLLLNNKPSTTSLPQLDIDGPELLKQRIGLRHHEAKTNFTVGKNGILHKDSEQMAINKTSDVLLRSAIDAIDEVDTTKTCDVYFCYSQDDMSYAAILGQMINSHYNDVVMSYGHEIPTERLRKLDLAKIIVIFLSKKFTESAQLMDELHHAVFRCRSAKNKITYVIQSSDLPMLPTYLHILPCDVNFTDEFWKKMKSEMVVGNAKFNVTGELIGSYRCEPARVVGLQKAAFDVARILTRQGEGDTTPDKNHVFINVLDTGDSTVTSMPQLLGSAETADTNPPPSQDSKSQESKSKDTPAIEDSLPKTEDPTTDNTPKTTEKDNTPKTTEKDNTPKTTEKDNTPKTTEKDNAPKTTENDNMPNTTEKDNPKNNISVEEKPQKPKGKSKSCIIV